ncbi:cupredoxin domain-containing protein [Conexibacter sp. CPCC 206217]|uniref:cupredoxin domain-containing protein n=1 Tax=Conexibacter sp. CPCC 206217 TaxID=3064574 RepID=UPI002729046A|nr:cupredoxin domain-containing protein [Conexibacter sp. CPCC 206217]MDO8211910.1 cupredoxin domain-containing protein [Conexibacter sp. CPCC 206217]
MLVCAVLGAAALTPALVAAQAKRPAPASTAVGVSQREFRLTPYRTRVPVGEVRFNVTNYGEDVHDLVVRDARGRVLRSTADVKPGGRAVLRVRLGRGSYRLSCDVANHAQLGMRSGFTVVRR